MMHSTNGKDCSSVGSDESFVDVPALDRDFVIKIGIKEKGVHKYHRIRLGSLVDSSENNDKVRYAKLLEAGQSRASHNNTRQTLVEFLYQDMDGDVCVIASDEDLGEAIRQFQQANKGYIKVEASFCGNAASSIRPGRMRTPETASSAGVISSVPKVADSVSSRILRAMLGPKVEEPGDDCGDEKPQDLTEANPVSVRAHLVDNFLDHINFDGTPYFFTGPYDEDDNCRRCGGEKVFAKYTIDGEPCKSAFFAMDDIFVDLTESLPPGLIGFAIPAQFMERLVASGSHQRRFLEAPPCLDPMEVSFDLDNPPSVVFVREKKKLDEKDEDGNPMGELETTDQGTLFDIMNSVEHRHFYKCSGVFEAVHFMTTPCFTSSSVVLLLSELALFEAHDDVLDSLKNGER